MKNIINFADQKRIIIIKLLLWEKVIKKPERKDNSWYDGVRRRQIKKADKPEIKHVISQEKTIKEKSLIRRKKKSLQ